MLFLPNNLHKHHFLSISNMFKMHLNNHSQYEFLSLLHFIQSATYQINWQRIEAFFVLAVFSNPKKFRAIKMGAKEGTICWDKPVDNPRCVAR